MAQNMVPFKNRQASQTNTPSSFCSNERVVRFQFAGNGSNIPKGGFSWSVTTHVVVDEGALDADHDKVAWPKVSRFPLRVFFLKSALKSKWGLSDRTRHTDTSDRDVQDNHLP